MFESDDFDQVLSQFDFSVITTAKTKGNGNIYSQKPAVLCSKLQTEESQHTISKNSESISVLHCDTDNVLVEDKLENCSKSHAINAIEKTPQVCETAMARLNTLVSPKHTKRKIINSYFDHRSKRKFPGPAGLLSGALVEPNDDSICQIELLSQDIDCTPNLRRDLFDSPIWNRLKSDAHSWKLCDVDCIKDVKQQAHSGHLKTRKARVVAGFVETVDRSAIDPMIILRDATGTIKCTLHRDAWSTFSPYIVCEYCALVLQKPTVLTTGAAFKNHYLNITLSNILAVYSSAIVNDEDGNITLPEGYSVGNEGKFTVIKSEKCTNNLGTSLDHNDGEEDLLNGLDSIFSDDVF